MARWLCYIALALVLTCGVVRSQTSSCSSCTGVASSCCGSFGCCSARAKAFYNALIGDISGQCRTDTLTIYSQCIKVTLDCLTAGTAFNKPPCSSILPVCATVRCSAGSNSVACAAEVRAILTQNATTVPACVANSCVQSKQVPGFTKSFYSVVCYAIETVAPFPLGCLADVTLTCPTVSVTCMSKTSCTTSYHGSQSSHGQVVPTPSASAMCSVRGKTVDCRKVGRLNGTTACCNISGTSLGCCTPDTDSFLMDLVRDVSPQCGRDLIKDQKACFTNVAICLSKVQKTISSGSPLNILGALTALKGCDVLDKCSQAASSTATCTRGEELCNTVITETSQYRPFASFLPKRNNKLCLPTSCTADVTSVSKLLYAALCFPFCQLTGGGASLGLGGTCFISSVNVSCPVSGSSALYTDQKADCQTYTFNVGTMPPMSSPFGGGAGTHSGGHAVPPTSGDSRSPSSHGVSSALVAIVCVCSILIVVLVTIGVVYFVRRRRSTGRAPVTYSGLDDEDDDIIT
eukprot:scpid60930/ scgid26177/ 